MLLDLHNIERIERDSIGPCKVRVGVNLGESTVSVLNITDKSHTHAAHQCTPLSFEDSGAREVPFGEFFTHRNDMFTLDEDISSVWLPSCGIQNVYIHNSNLVVRIRLLQ